MSAAEFGSLMLPLLLLLATAHLFGHLFSRIWQPRVVGEIFAGIVLGPSVFGAIWPEVFEGMFASAGVANFGLKRAAVIGFLYNLGLLLLMFASGAETKHLFDRQDRRELAWLGGVGTALPFMIALLGAPLLPLQTLIGPANQRLPLLLVIGIAVAVTSIPVISKILHDLGILHTRFARLILGVAIVEDIALWGVLAVATALAASAVLPQARIAAHLLVTFVYFTCGLTLFPRLLHKVTRANSNVLARSAPVAYVITVLLAYTALAAALDVNLVFAAFLAGYALVSDFELRPATSTLGNVAFASFIPLYFAVVGFQLDLSRTFSFRMLAVFLTLACLVKLVSAGLGARLAGFSWFDSVNLSITLNARGGPGIVLASVAYDAQIINSSFYTTLVLVAILTSQAAGAWLEFVLRHGWPLLGSQTTTTAGVTSRDNALS